MNAKFELQLEGTPEEIRRASEMLIHVLPWLKPRLVRITGLEDVQPVETERVYLIGAANRRKAPDEFALRRVAACQNDALAVRAGDWPGVPAIVQAARGTTSERFDVRRFIIYWWQPRGEWGRYVGRSATKLWTQEEFEVLLDSVCAARNHDELVRLFTRHDMIWNRVTKVGDDYAGSPGSAARWNAYATAARARGKVYEPTGLQRTLRRGPLTYGEKWLIIQAVDCRITDGAPQDPDAGYLALLLNRKLDFGLVKGYLDHLLRHNRGLDL